MPIDLNCPAADSHADACGVGAVVQHRGGDVDDLPGLEGLGHDPLGDARLDLGALVVLDPCHRDPAPIVGRARVAKLDVPRPRPRDLEQQAQGLVEQRSRVVDAYEVETLPIEVPFQ